MGTTHEERAKIPIPGLSCWTRRLLGPAQGFLGREVVRGYGKNSPNYVNYGETHVTGTAPLGQGRSSLT